MKTVIKRDGVKKEFDSTKIKRVIKLANNSVEKEERLTDDAIDEIVESILFDLNSLKDENGNNLEEVKIETIQDYVEKELSKANYTVGKAFAFKRKERSDERFLKEEIVQMMEAKYSGQGWDRQNANIDGLSFDGKAGEAHGVYDKEFALRYMITEKFAKNHRDMLVYIHDLDNYKKGKHNCLTFPADDYRDNGMSIKIPKDIRKAGSVSTESQLVMVELQSQSMPQFGGVSVSHWDSTLAPLVKKDFYKFYMKAYDRAPEITKFFDKIFKGNLDKKISKSTSIDSKIYTKYNKRVAKYAMDDLIEEVHQATEGLLHNANTLQSRSGNQLPFTSINYGADTTPEGRIVIKEILNCWEEGIGELHLSPIFPCGIFQYKQGVNDKPGTPNYDLKKRAIEVLIKRDYPNFANCDWSVQKKAFIKSQAIKADVLGGLTNEERLTIAKLPMDMQKTLGFTSVIENNGEVTFTMNSTEEPFEMMSTMGCRTYNGFDINFTKEYFKKVLNKTIVDGKLPRNMLWSGIQKDGRGNIAPATVILPMVAMKAKQKTKDKPEYIVEAFLDLLEKYIGDAKDELLERYKWIAAQDAASSKFMYGNCTMKGYEEEEGIVSALRHGTFAIGQLGLAECLQILVGCDHTEEKGMKVAKQIEQLFMDKCNEYKEHYKLNFGVYYTPAENLCFTAMKAFTKKYGLIENVNAYRDKDGNLVGRKFFTNSIHVPVWKKISPFEKIDIESQLTGYSSAGCITYIEIDDECKFNLKAIEQFIDYAMEHDIPYFALNFQINECTECGNTDNITEECGCPICGSHKINWLRRITGYLNGNAKESFNDGKQDEERLREKHTKYIKFK